MRRTERKLAASAPRAIMDMEACAALVRALGVGHRDGNESNGSSRNLFTVCKSCNGMQAHDDKRAGRGVRTRQYNPKRRNPGAQSLGAYVSAAVDHTRGAHDAGGKVIHETPKSKRKEFAREIAWRKGYRNPRGRAEGELEVADKDAHGDVDYEPTSKHLPDKCANCAHFIAATPPRCQTVVSPIKPGAYCERYDPATTGKNPRHKNSDGDELYRKFHGARPDNKLAYDVPLLDPYGLHPEVGQLGLLVRLIIGEGVRVEAKQDGETIVPIDEEWWHLDLIFVPSLAEYHRMERSLRTQPQIDQLKSWLRKNGTPDVAGAPVPPGTRSKLSNQLYIVGGNQNIDEHLSEIGVDPDKEIIDCGFVYMIEYFTQKRFDHMDPIDYFHTFAEKHGSPPRLLYWRKAHHLQLAGGDYTVTSRGIEN